MLRAQTWEFGLLGGASGYMGDLNPDNPFKFNDWAAGAMGRYNFNSNYSVRLNLIRANIHGSSRHFGEDTEEYGRNLAFQSPLYEASLTGELNFFKFIPCFDRVYYTPYLFAGVGVARFNPQRRVDGELVTLYDKPTEVYEQPYFSNTEKYSRTTVLLPLGVGFKYNFRGPWTLGLELGYRFTLSDHLDDVAGMYPDFVSPESIYAPEYRGITVYDRDLAMLLANPSSVDRPAGSMRGDSRNQDSYMVLNVTVSYAIFKKGCPLFYKR